MYVVGARNNRYHNFKIVFHSRVKFLAKIVSGFYKPFFNEVEVQDTSNIVIRDKR